MSMDQYIIKATLDVNVNGRVYSPRVVINYEDIVRAVSVDNLINMKVIKLKNAIKMLEAMEQSQKETLARRLDKVAKDLASQGPTASEATQAMVKVTNLLGVSLRRPEHSMVELNVSS